MNTGLQIKRPLFLSDFNKKLIYLNIQTSNFIKICPVRAELFHAERSKDTET